MKTIKWYCTTPSDRIEYDSREEAVEALIREMEWFDTSNHSNGVYAILDQSDVDREIEFWSHDHEEDKARAEAIVEFLKGDIPFPCLVGYDAPRIVTYIDTESERPSFNYDTKVFLVERIEEEEEE